MICTEVPNNLEIFIDYLDDIHANIKFTSSYSSTNVLFLDVNVYLVNGVIKADLLINISTSALLTMLSTLAPLS